MAILPLSTAVTRWIQLREATAAWCPDTARNARLIWRRALALVGDRDIREITSTDIETLCLDGAERSIGWRNYRRTYVMGLFEWALRHGHIQRDPTVDVWPFVRSGAASVFRALSREEERILSPRLDEATARYLVAGIATGLRRSTLYKLDWRWVTEEWIIAIPGAVVKNRKGLRIPINRRAIDALGPRRPAGAILEGLPHPDTINVRLRRAALAAGLPNPHLVTTHQLRRTWVERFRDAGGTREECQLIQGWSSSNVLLEAYWPRVPEARARAIVEMI